MARFDRLADIYDLLVNWPARLTRERPFFERLFREHRVERVLDAACGTGRHAVLFAGQGYQVVGSDISAAMIRRARRHAAESGVKVRFVVAAFDDLRKRFAGEFDAVVCLGNSLAACGSKALARRAMRQFALCLGPGGLLIVQMLDFDAMRAADDRFESPRSGTLDGREFLLFKFFDLTTLPVKLNLAIFDRAPGGQWEWEVVTNPLYGPSASELRGLARAAGFERIRFYANHRFEPYRRQGDQMLLVATRKGT